MPGISPEEPKVTDAPSTAKVEIVLKYDGRDVDDGTMPIEDVISALRGFSNAYGRVASTRDPNGQHQIRVAAINRSSFAVTVLAWTSQHKATIAALATAGAPIATAIVTLIIRLIEAKKSAKGQPTSSVTVDGNNNTVIVTTAGDNTKVVMGRDVYEVYKDRTLDGELSKIVSPLRQGGIDAVSITSNDRHTADSVVITSSEKEFFRSEDSKTSTSKPVEVDGYFVSLNKDTNRGRFRMQNGNAVPYHFIGDDPSKMYADFAYKGPTRVQCIASFDSNLELKSLEITNVARLQTELEWGDPNA